MVEGNNWDVTRSKPSNPQSPEMVAATELARMGFLEGLALTGPDGLLKRRTKTVV